VDFLNKIINDDNKNILPLIEKNSIDLILTDPPYIISRDSNYTKINDNTPEEAAKRFNVSIDFGSWDKDELDWEFLFGEFNRILKPGGTIIIFYDIWKMGELKDISDKHKLKQPRIGCWIKTNPVPINSSNNYLSNCSEYFATFVKTGVYKRKYVGPTFNSKYDNGFYTYPLCHGKERTDHPTQKPLKLIDDLILKHSNENDVILDPFVGSGTTALSAKNNNRNYIGIEIDTNYYNISDIRIK